MTEYWYQVLVCTRTQQILSSDRATTNASAVMYELVLLSFLTHQLLELNKCLKSSSAVIELTSYASVELCSQLFLFTFHVAATLVR